MPSRPAPNPTDNDARADARADAGHAAARGVGEDAAGPDDSATSAAAVGRHLARNLVSLRRSRQLTQDALAGAAQLPRSTIANLESGDANPSLQVLLKVTQALAVPLEELIAPPRAKVRHWAADAVGARHRGRGVVERALIPESIPDQLSTVMDFDPGAHLGGTPHLPGTREFFTCLAGQVEIFVAGERHRLAAGEVLGFPGNLPHSYHNPDAQRPARGVSLVVLAKAGV